MSFRGAEFVRDTHCTLRLPCRASPRRDDGLRQFPIRQYTHPLYPDLAIVPEKEDGANENITAAYISVNDLAHHNSIGMCCQFHTNRREFCVRSSEEI